MAERSLAITIRKALLPDLPTLSHLHYQAFLRDPTVSRLWRDCSPTVIRDWLWTLASYRRLKMAPRRFYLNSSKKVTRSRDSLICYSAFRFVSEGIRCLEESAKMHEPRSRWHEKSLSRYGEYI